MIINSKIIRTKSLSKRDINASSVSCRLQVFEKEKVICINFDSSKKMGTIGVIEGEIITSAFEYAARKNLPVILFCSSAGIRVTDGTKALMQMAKISSAINLHKQKKLLYICVVLDPTLGGASASFVPLADIIIAERTANFGFSGKRIIKLISNEDFPDDFQTAEFVKKNGLIDIVADKEEIFPLLKKLIKLNKRCKNR